MIYVKDLHIDESDFDQLKVFVEEHGREYFPPLTRLIESIDFWKENEDEGS